ncbi:polyketide cyclase [Sphingobacteriales bacterium UPWRP_1]|nr:polyketide cyclase [Sphingobacteriales bacterium TSM_CSM]PSJ72840.1 polyketide cyclase [Sphingobacteriales bacterium UPWRP_1]
MFNNRYHFITRWQVTASKEEVYHLLEDVETLVNWWPSVYLEVTVLEKGQPGGVGKVINLYTKGWLPYTLRWKFIVTKTDFPNGFAIDAQGDFEGTGVWTFEQQPGSDTCHINYDWNITARKPLLRYLTFLLRPVFAANHRWAMQKGLESLQLELQRRRAKTPEERAKIPPPPPPTFVFGKK